MSEIKMLPLPEVLQGRGKTAATRNYARAVAEHNVAARDAEIEALRKKLTEYQVAESVAFSKQRVAEARAERLAEALQLYGQHRGYCDLATPRTDGDCPCGFRLVRERSKEKKNG